ncbi:HTH-type transcriptional regulator AbgR [Serratia fonticola]|uniref:LysR substrate-binding domain-containing protein n=1 Tax=Serratia fonticola TaxID=47917 RepID=UPI002182EFC9|nr:LysR substrate-binding domain-containing protein [Serratia fonticola]CAI2135465.1 HTH-type transcriptional regulator AbgR [Serratia fonticola]
MRNLPKPNQLKMFQSILEHGSFRAAAKALHQTQPALTLSMNELEKTLGAPLMVRSPGGVVLTEAGKLFESRVQVIMRELERAVVDVRQYSSLAKGAVTLGSSSLPIFTVLPLAISHFHENFPQVSINLKEGELSDLLPALRSGKLDFAIAATVSDSIPNSEFIEEPFFNAPFAILAHREHPLAQSTTLDQLNGAKWYLPTSQTGYYSQIEKLLFPDGHQTRQTVVRSDTGIAATPWILNAQFLTVAAKEVLQVPYLGQQLCIIPIKKTLPDASYRFIYSRHFPLTQVAKRMMDKLRRECQNYPWYYKVKSEPISQVTGVSLW